MRGVSVIKDSEHRLTANIKNPNRGENMNLEIPVMKNAYFRKSTPKYIYENNKRTDKQAAADDGRLLWTVKVELQLPGEKDLEELYVVVPCIKDPAEGLQLNEQIAFVNFHIISGRRYNGGGRYECFTADEIRRKKRGDTTENNGTENSGN